LFETAEQYYKELLKYIGKLKSKAVTVQPTETLKKNYRYYTGRFEQGDKVKNYRNVIQGIVDTKKTLIADNDMVTEVAPAITRFSDFAQLQTAQDVADILDAGLKHVHKVNNYEIIEEDTIFDALVAGCGINEVLWDDDLGYGIGDVRINCIDPLKFFPDPSAKRIEDCNYIFVEESYSPITIKNKYPDKADKINVSSKKEGATSEPGKIFGKHVTENSGTKRLQYSFENPEDVEKNAENIVVWKCYLKDDSVFTAEMLDAKTESEQEKIGQLRYPGGRVIIFVEGATDYVLEDKAIDYGFEGFPIDVFVPGNTKDLWGKGESENLFEIQDRINRAYAKKQSLIGSFLSILFMDSKSGLHPNQLINEKGVAVIDNLQRNTPTVVTNNTLSELEVILKASEMYKADAREIGRVNEHMISGERQKGVNSGDMVEDLNESPLTAIRAIQKKYKEFRINQSKKIIKLMQKFYNVERYIRMSEGKFAGISNGNIQVMKEAEKNRYEVLYTISSDLTVCDYEVDIVAGAEMPRSRTGKANLTSRLYEQGILGQGSDAIDEYLTALDYPNRRNVIERLKQQEEQSANDMTSKLVMVLDKFKMDFKDLPQFAQYQVLAECGIQVPQEATKEEIETELDLESKELDNAQKRRSLSENSQENQIKAKQQNGV
jgi:hypothetical protein